jgi:transcription elongation GreA/GreB family factor
VNNAKLTQYEYDTIFAHFKKLQHKQGSLRQSHIDAVSEGDDRECDAWSLTNDLSSHNYSKLKEINDFLVDTKIIKPTKNDKVSHGKTIRVNINGSQKEYYICHPQAVEYLSNGLSTESPIGKFLLGKTVGEYNFMNQEDISIKIKIISIYLK